MSFSHIIAMLTTGIVLVPALGPVTYPVAVRVVFPVYCSVLGRAPVNGSGSVQGPAPVMDLVPGIPNVPFIFVSLVLALSLIISLSPPL